MKRRMSPLVLAFILPPLACAAQSCTTSGLDGQDACIRPADSSGNPVMPLLAFDYDPCTVSSAQVSVQCTNPSAAGFNHTAGLYSIADASGSGEWMVDWTKNSLSPDSFYEGGNAVYTMTPFNNGAPESFNFTISGVNPSLGAMTNFLQGNNAPWWFGHALSQESSNRQFYAQSGNPVFGPPDGFGVAQLDGSGNSGLLRDDDLWAWTENLIDGIVLANGKQQKAYDYIGTQYNNMLATANGGPILPPPMTFAGCPTMTLTGPGAAGFGDAEWITSYNGGHFTRWDAPSASWTFRTGYISALCANPSQTL